MYLRHTIRKKDGKVHRYWRRRTARSRCRNEPPRSIAVSERSIDRAGPRCHRKIKPVASGQNQTAADSAERDEHGKHELYALSSTLANFRSGESTKCPRKGAHWIFYTVPDVPGTV
jgi:hypothetical protein